MGVHAKRLAHCRPTANGVILRGTVLGRAFGTCGEGSVGPLILFLEDLGWEILSVLEHSLWSP